MACKLVARFVADKSASRPPLYLTSPLEGLITFIRTLASVVFPHPDSPTIASTSPDLISREIPLRACNLWAFLNTPPAEMKSWEISINESIGAFVEAVIHHSPQLYWEVQGKNSGRHVSQRFSVPAPLLQGIRP